jgi:hypothetical protein
MQDMHSKTDLKRTQSFRKPTIININIEIFIFKVPIPSMIETHLL